jgi:hypothetical protein
MFVDKSPPEAGKVKVKTQKQARLSLETTEGRERENEMNIYVILSFPLEKLQTADLHQGNWRVM